MANNTVKFDIKAAIDTRGLDEFQSQLGELRSTAEPLDRVLGDAVRSIKEWASASRLSERNTAAATSAIDALTRAMTAGGNEWRKGTQAATDLNRTLRETTSAANAARAALAAPARTTIGATQQISDLRKGLQELTIGSSQYLAMLQQITEREALLGRRTGRAGVVAANQAFEGALLTRGYGAQENLQAMPNTTAALRQRLSELSQEYPNVIRGSQRYLEIGRQMSAIERELAKDLTGTTQALRQRSAATQAKIDAVRAYNEQAIRERVIAGEMTVAERRRTAFGDVPQAMRTESGAFIAPPYRSSGYAGMGTMYDRPIGPQTALDYFQSRANQFPAPIGPQTPLQYWQSRTSSGAMQAPQAPTELFRSIGGIDTAGTTARLQTMGRSYQEVAAKIRETAQAAGGSTRALQAERAAWEQLRASVTPASREYKQAGQEMRRLDRQLGTSTRGGRFLESAGAISAGAFFGGPEGLVGGLAGMAIGGPGAALGGAAIGAQLGIIRKSIGDTAVYSAELEKLRIALRGVVGGNDEYAKSLQIIDQVSTTLNLNQRESLQGFTRLAAAVSGAGGSVADAEIVFRGVTDAIKATGGSSQDVQSAILAMSQVFSKGKVSAEELQGQLGERLPGAVTLFAQATGRTLPQLSKDLEQGTVGLNDLMKFTQALSQRYASTAQTIAGSSADAGAKLAATLDKLRGEFGKSFEGIGASIQSATNRLAEFGLEVFKTYNIQRQFGGKVLSPDERAAIDDEAMQIARLRQPTDAFKRGEEFQSVRAQLERNRMLQLGYQMGVIQAPGTQASTSPTNFQDPKSDNANNQADREKRKQEEAAARQQRLNLQIYNDQVRLQEQLAENRIRLEDRVFQYKQELLRREREQQLQLDQLRQQRLLVNLTPEGRAAVAPLVDVLNRLRDLSGQRQTLRDQLEAAKQQERSAQRQSENTRRFNGAYREDSQSNIRPAIGDQFLSQILGGQFEDVAGLQPLPLERMYRQMGRQVQRWTNYIQNEARYVLKQTFGTTKPLIPQDIIDSTTDRVRVLTNVIQSFDPLEVQFRELENQARGRSGQGRSKPSGIPLTDFMKLFRNIERRVTVDAANSLYEAGGFLGQLGPNADLSDFLTDGTRRFLFDGIRQVLSNDEGGYKRRAMEGSFSGSFKTFFNDSVKLIDAERSRGGAGRGAAGGFDSLELPAIPIAPSGGVDYLRQYRNLQELMEPPRIIPGVEAQFDGASLAPLLKKFGSIAALGYIPVTIENPDVIAQATGRIVEHLHGDPNRPGYDRRGHGLESNAHDHFGFDSEATTRRVMQELRRRGYQVTRFGVRSGHSTNSLHYSNRAFDVPWSQFGSGPIGPNDFARSRRLRAEVEEILGLATGATTTLANGREIRTPGAASAAMRAASAQSNLLEARASVGAVEKEFAALERDFPKFVDAITGLGIDQTLQSLRQQELALRDNYKEWQIRNRMTQEGYKPEQIEFEILRNKYLKDQERSITAINRVLEDQEPILQKLLKPEEYAKFMEMVAKTKSEIQNQTNNVVNAQAALVQAQLDPYNQWRNKIVELNKSLRDFNDTQKLVMDMSGQFSSNLAGGFSNAASAIITGNGSIQQSFADLFNNIANMFIDTISRMLADQATKYILSLFAPAPIGGAVAGSGVASLFSSALPMLGPAAGITGSFATGGISSGPTSGYPVTLHGTEAIVPLPNGRAIPVEMAGGGSTNVVVNVNMATGEMDVSGGERDGELLGKALSEAVQAELIRQKRPGGLLYR